ncbi:beta-lactamase family protein [Nocardia otitidiscaviarum]|uniref:Beta-lactamase family protein n=1 Tax=Nocardia otitidiscaviarum TaxID=1823 RepID=A0A516NHA7_9NOCA|nr:serine hydrolase domain-containing protein [Nocardia otitidiscaviarum]MCP9623527.1 beta-lactamase family protein [Nocardia otitidiscaviarum]QDP78282.1 beta-lactamase family protein [Nocardia otitidiscaviarum]
MQNGLFRTAVLSCAVIAASVFSSAPVTAAPREDALDAVVDLAASNAAADVLLRVSDPAGARLWTARGTDLTHPGALGPDSRFRIGSVTKTFVATVVMQLVDEGRIALDGTIADQLAYPVPGGDRITVRQLLNHTSGLYDYMKEPGMSTNRWRGDDRFRGYRPEQLLDTAFRHEPYFAPGTDFRYSNTNYIVLGKLVEQVTGNAYGQEIDRRILRPLGLAHTLVPGQDASVPEPAVRARRTLDDGTTVDVTEMNPSLDWAAGEMLSTTADLDTFLNALLSGGLTSPAALAEMMRTVPMGQGFHYGLGIERFDAPCGGSLWGHGGELLGYLTYAYRSPTHRTMTLAIASAHSDELATFYAATTAAFCGS